jgi:hypothetical protein
MAKSRIHFEVNRLLMSASLNLIIYSFSEELASRGFEDEASQFP